MLTLPDFIELQVKSYYVTPQYVANRYGVSRLRVHRAINAGLLKAVVIELEGTKNVVLLDQRHLPERFPRKELRW